MREKILRLSGLCFFGMFSLGRSAMSQINLLEDPSLENWNSNSSLAAWSKESGVVLAQESAQKYGGECSAKLQMTGASDRGIYQDVPVVAGNVYAFKVWLLDAGGTAKMGITIVWYDANKTYLNKYAGPEKTTLENVWQQISIEAAAPAGAGYARCRIRAYDSNDGPGYADEALFSTDTPLGVQINSYFAVFRNGSVVLHWRTQSELNTLGFHVLRAESESGPFHPVGSALIPGQGNASAGKEYIFTDRNVFIGKKYWYQIEEIDATGNRHVVGLLDAVSPDDGYLPPIQTCLSNHPNPFNPFTTIQFQVSKTETESGVYLSIYGILGRQIRTLIQNIRKPGGYSVIWDGCDENGREMESGLYLCVLESREKVIESMRIMKAK